jgi:hypothetical protein
MGNLDIDFGNVPGTFPCDHDALRTTALERSRAHDMGFLKHEVMSFPPLAAFRVSFEILCGVPAKAAICPDPPSERIPGLEYGGQRESIKSVPA